MPSLTRTLQCRIEKHPALGEMAALMGRVERKLYAAYARGETDKNRLKREFIATFGITSRQYNAARVALDGKIDGARQQLRGQAGELESRLQALDKKLKSTDDSTLRSGWCFLKQREDINHDQIFGDFG